MLSTAPTTKPATIGRPISDGAVGARIGADAVEGRLREVDDAALAEQQADAEPGDRVDAGEDQQIDEVARQDEAAGAAQTTSATAMPAGERGVSRLTRPVGRRGRGCPAASGS